MRASFSAAALLVALLASTATADPIAVRYPEGPAHGYLVLTDLDDKPLAHGELVQWLEADGVVASLLTFRFEDGSTYDETVRFSQKKVFRLVSYELEQRGPSFSESAAIRFDQSGQYRASVRSGPDAKEETKSGRVEVPVDVMNGMTSVFLKNLMPSGAAQTHMLSFTPDPVVLKVDLSAEGTDGYSVGRTERKATRYRIKPSVPGVKGVVATVMGKQPAAFNMWIAEGKAPTLIRFQGQMYAEGPQWRIGLSAPRLRP